MAADDYILFLWCTWAKLKDALRIVQQWGFDYKTVAFTWVKQNPLGGGLWTGMGFWTRSNPEPCLFATRGRPRRVLGCKVDGGGFGRGDLHPDAEAVHNAVTGLVRRDRNARLLVLQFEVAGTRPD